MHIIIQYSICAAIVFTLITMYNWRVKNMNVFKNNIFLNYVIIGSVANIIDLIRCVISITSISCS